MRVLVTGSTGLLGHNLTRQLLADGHQVRAVARSADKFERLLGDSDAEPVRGDMLDVPSFAPALDLRTRESVVIGNRALHRDPEVVASLARAWMSGMGEAGMQAVGKHFPGHGSVEGDSHLMLPVDGRDLETLRTADMLVFERMIHYGLPAVMAALCQPPAATVTTPARLRPSMICGVSQFPGRPRPSWP